MDESKIHKNLRCLVCQGQPIAINSDFAITLKMVVKDLIKQEKMRRKFIIFFQINMEIGFYNPKFNLGNFLLWGLPYLIFIIGGVIIVFFIRKSSKKT